MIACGTFLGLAGTDLVLPAVPSLPAALGGTLSEAQFVLAAFTGGTVIGLLLFGELGSRIDQRILLAVSLLAYAAFSALAGAADSLGVLIGWRAAQGATATAAAVFAPGMLRALYSDEHAVAALGRINSIEVLAPALAPILGLWLLDAFGWRSTFHVMTLLTGSLGLLILVRRQALPRVVARHDEGSYGDLLRNRPFLRHTLGHAFTIGALLVFVFGAPAVFVASLDATVVDFIVMQALGIALFIMLANASGYLTRRFGADRMILIGSWTSAAGGVVMLAYALTGGENTVTVTIICLLLNAGLGLRGPAGFHRAVVAADDDARGSALVILAMLGVTSLGTALVAPFITDGLVPLSSAAALLAVAALVLRLTERPG